MATEFIAHDFCGWNEQYGRYTHCPSGATLVCRPGMDQTAWDRAQLEFLSKLPGLPVHSCPGTYTTEGTRLMGTTDEICERLRSRLGAFHVGDRVRMTAAYLATLSEADRSNYSGVYTVTAVRGSTVEFVDTAGNETGCDAGWLELAKGTVPA
jgi:hypothetical protein